MKQQCVDYGWETFVFIQNFYPGNLSYMCLGHTWYLANDMQFFLITPIILALYCCARGLAYTIIFLLFAANFATVGYSTYHEEDTYIKPWYRIAPYLQGMLLGIFYYEYKNRSTNNEFKRRCSADIFKALEASIPFDT